MKKNSTKKITSIGGSALIEGVMMRGPQRTTVSVRKSDTEIYSEDIQMTTLSEKCPIFKVPFFRGIAGMIDSMRLSYKSLMLSADKAMEFGEYEEEEPSKFEKWLDEKFGDKLMKVLMVLSSILGVAIAIGLFYFLPYFLYDVGMVKLFPSLGEESEKARLVKSVFGGLLRIILFLGYIILCSQMTEMKRVFMYHGAEHKTIFCYENEEELTVENVKKQTRFHPRCGTSFLVLMLIVGIIIGLFVPVAPFGYKLLHPVIKLLLLPVSCGVGYELIKLCGKYDNAITKFIAAPGLWTQRITTKEPDDKMIEVAIKSMLAVIPEDGSDIVNKK